MKESLQYLFFWIWVILLNMGFFGYIYVPENDVVFLLGFADILESIRKWCAPSFSFPTES